MCFNIKISSNLKKTKKKPFFAFFCVPLKKKFKWPPIGHYRRLTPCTQLISKIMFQFFQNTCGSQRYLQKYGCQTPPKSVDPDLCPSKKLFFGHFFWENLSFDPFRHHLPPPHDIHRWKAMDLTLHVVQAPHARVQPVCRQIFCNASGKLSSQDLTQCLRKELFSFFRCASISCFQAVSN